jgi:hypothetical protein
MNDPLENDLVETILLAASLLGRALYVHLTSQAKQSNDYHYQPNWQSDSPHRMVLQQGLDQCSGISKFKSQLATNDSTAYSLNE